MNAAFVTVPAEGPPGSITIWYRHRMHPGEARLSNISDPSIRTKHPRRAVEYEYASLSGEC